MKKLITIGLITLLYISSGCNSNDSKDSVDKATADNNKKDTTSMTSDAKKDTMSAMPVNDDVAKFAVKAANAGMTEVKAGEIAEAKAADKDVKDFGSMMVQDHTKAGDILKNIASEKNITLPASVSDDMQKHIDDLNKKTGKDFDKDYMQMMVSDHKDVIDAFEDAAKNSKDPAFKDFAVKTLPTLYKHLGAAKAIVKSKHY